jgi:hypothetical protein
MTSISTVNVRPSVNAVTRAFEPTPLAGPPSFQSRIMWLVNGS